MYREHHQPGQSAPVWIVGAQRDQNYAVQFVIKSANEIVFLLLNMKSEWLVLLRRCQYFGIIDWITADVLS